MKNTWIKNKWLLLTILIYSLSVTLFSEVNTIPKLLFFISSFFVIPYTFNYYVRSGGPWFAGFIVGGIFGIYTGSFFGYEYVVIDSILKFSSQNIILFWALIIIFNVFNILHKDSYLERKRLEDQSSNRDSKLDDILNPTKNKFFL